MLWEQNNILREQDNLLWEQNSMSWEQREVIHLSVLEIWPYKMGGLC
jgi:hypothetical protein